MKKTLLAIALSAAAIGAQASVTWEHYNANPDAESVITMPNGAVGDIAAISKASEVMRITAEISHEQITDNVWLLNGPAYAPVIIELEDGLIVAPTGEHAGDGELFRSYIREHISSKPVIGVIYDHNHYVAGTETLLDGDDAVIVAHPNLNNIIRARSGDGQANAVIDEMQPHLASRAMIHYGNHNPASGKDAPMLPFKVELGHESAWVPANKTVEDGESFTIGGLEFVAYHHETDTKDNITLYIPEYKMVLSNVVWPVTNMYTMRGDAYRDPATWSDALRDIRDLEPEYVLEIGGGATTLVGKENIRDTVNSLLDARNFTFDQAIRLTNLGVSADQMKHYMALPETLVQHPYVNNVYGQFETFAEAFPVQNHGYFSGQPHQMHNLPSQEQAKHMIELAGGVEATYKAWQKAMDKGEYLWAKDLGTALYYNAPANTVARQALADTLRKLGQYSEGLIARNFYIAGARSLEGKTEPSLSGTQSANWVASNPSQAVYYMRTKISPSRATGINDTLNFEIDGERFSLEIRNSVAELLSTPATNGEVIKVSSEDFGRYYAGELKAKDIAEGKALELLNVFDEYEHIPMYPTSFEHLM
ncbi:MAG: alkyl sulfatase dimerization domain-containing protein [Endozoicomonas sp.]